MSRAKIQIRPLSEAVARMGRKTPVAKALTSAEWSELPLALRERSFWAARFAKADVLQAMHDMLGRRLSLERQAMERGDLLVNRENFITEMRGLLETSGYVPPAGKEGTIRDMTSTGRLGLIFDINTAQAQEFARFKAETADTLDAFPARELYRAEDRQVPRNWRERWQRAGGRLFEGGRMVAAKDDPVWVGISAFGTPFPPFDFNSGMEVRDISRQEAERLGVLAPGEGITPPVVGFNDSLQKSVARYEPGIREAILKDFEGRAALDGEVLKWIGGGQP